MASQEDRQMELAALVMFASIALWFVEEAAGPRGL